ncbi:MAG: gas vesicle protein [Solirubrobacterales bacterium]|nr:gas vesicle protein [Solirubrobacterales bacterium]
MALDPDTRQRAPRRYVGDALHPREAPSNLADILERVLDKGIVIAGDIQINLLDIELITLKIRLLIASVDRAREMGINWWESDPTLSVQPTEEKVSFRAEFERDDEDGGLEARIERLERRLESGQGNDKTAQSGKGETTRRQTGGATRKPASRPASARRATGSRGGNAPKR